MAPAQHRGLVVSPSPGEGLFFQDDKTTQAAAPLRKDWMASSSVG
jgi:hypothetical protein